MRPLPQYTQPRGLHVFTDGDCFFHVNKTVLSDFLLEFTALFQDRFDMAVNFTLSSFISFIHQNILDSSLYDTVETQFRHLLPPDTIKDSRLSTKPSSLPTSLSSCLVSGPDGRSQRPGMLLSSEWDWALLEDKFSPLEDFVASRKERKSKLKTRPPSSSQRAVLPKKKDIQQLAFEQEDDSRTPPDVREAARHLSLQRKRQQENSRRNRNPHGVCLKGPLPIPDFSTPLPQLSTSSASSISSSSRPKEVPRLADLSMTTQTALQPQAVITPKDASRKRYRASLKVATSVSPVRADVPSIDSGSLSGSVTTTPVSPFGNEAYEGQQNQKSLKKRRDSMKVLREALNFTNYVSDCGLDDAKPTIPEQYAGTPRGQRPSSQETDISQMDQYYQFLST